MLTLGMSSCTLEQKAGVSWRGGWGYIKVLAFKVPAGLVLWVTG